MRLERAVELKKTENKQFLFEQAKMKLDDQQTISNWKIDRLQITVNDCLEELNGKQLNLFD